jgi:hypothetical protein
MAEDTLSRAVSVPENGLREVLVRVSEDEAAQIREYAALHGLTYEAAVQELCLAGLSLRVSRVGLRPSPALRRSGRRGTSR